MKDIKDIHVTQIRIYPVGSIPYHILCIPTKLNQLKDFFHFGAQEIPFPLYDPNTPNLIMFNSGEIAVDDKNVIIDKLAFEGRKITLEVAGESKDADFAFLQITNFLNELTKKNDLDENNCLVKSDETKCVAHLDIDYWDIFSEGLRKFLKSALPKNFREPFISIESRKVTFEIIFKQPDDLQKEKIGLSPKSFLIEPYEATPLEKQIFHTHSPFDSDTHFQVIKTFESFFPLTPKSTKRKKSG